MVFCKIISLSKGTKNYDLFLLLRHFKIMTSESDVLKKWDPDPCQRNLTSKGTQDALIYSLIEKIGEN